ncbi:Kin of IRRE 3 protein [Rutstroemia sp. NJR-2017a BVV2]|nr:Kin of IRRE 3 protein [Rutstroemia sp. NJR-2017a BVV2]
MSGKVELGLDKYTINSIPDDFEGTNNAFFLCFAEKSEKLPYTCRSFSPFFGIEVAASEQFKRQVPPPSSSIASTPTNLDLSSISSLIPSVASSVRSVISTKVQIPITEPLLVTASSVFLSQIGATASPASAAQSSSGTITSYLVTVTTPPSSSTATATNAADVSITPQSKSSSSGLSLGAKIGIAIGALGFVFLLLLAALFLIRRRRRNHPPNTSQTPENLLLSSPYQNNDSRDMFVAEKLARSSIQERETHTPLTSYTEHEHDTSSHQHLPLPGSAFTTNTPMPISPRRSQAATTVSRDASISVSRAVSDASHVSRPGSREIGIGERSLFDEAPYTDDVSRSGGGNLNVPKVYKGALQAPFLSEPGMSAEEVARLEEEERRIDEAIAEAEEERKRARMRSAGGG